MFDLDGVLTRRDTMAELVADRLRKAPFRFAAAVPLALLGRLLPAQGRLAPAVNRLLVRLALRGLDREAYEVLARRTAIDLAGLPGNVPAQAIAQVRSAATGGRTVVVTGSERLVARSYLDAVGLPGVELIASSLRFDGSRVRLGYHVVGAAKVRELRRIGVDVARAMLYTDSSSDLPLARVVGSIVLVNPGRRAARVMVRELPTVRVVTWE